MNRTEKNKELHKILKDESEHIEFLVKGAKEENFDELYEGIHNLDKLMGQPIEELKKLFEVKKCQ